MTTITAQSGPTARRPRGTVTLFAVMAAGVLAVGAAVTLPRVFSSEPTTTQPAVIAPAVIGHTSEHSGDSVDRIGQKGLATQPKTGGNHPLGRVLNPKADQPGPLQPPHDPPRGHGAVL